MWYAEDIATITTQTMNHLHNVPLPKGKNRRSAETIPPRHKETIEGRTRGRRVVVFEAAATARDIIRVYVETIDEARQEKVIAF
jgi:hypothetical protein